MTYKVVEADLATNKEDIINLLRSNFTGFINPEKRFHWMYEQNPYGSPKCWLLKDEKKGEYIGCASLMPRRVYINGKSQLAGIVGDTVVNKAHRSLGPALMLQRPIISKCQNYFQFIYGFPNRLSEAVNLRAGYEIVGKNVRMVRPIRIKKTIKRFTNNFVASLISPLADACLSLNTIHFKEQLLFKNISFDILNYFDDSFDKLLETCEMSNLIIGERSTRYLNWRYISHPYIDFKIFAGKYNDGTLFGYIVFCLQNDNVSIYDIYSSNGYHVLLNQFIKECRKNKKINTLTVRLLEGSPIIKPFKKNRFLKRSSPLSIVIYSNETISSSFLKNPLNWHLVYGDSDV